MRWSRSGRPYDQKKFLGLKHLVRRLFERSYQKYLGDILGLKADTNDLDNNSAPPMVNNKKLYSLLKHSKQDSSGIASLKKDKRTFSVETDKTNILNTQFQSVFSPKSPVRRKSLAQRTLQDLT